MRATTNVIIGFRNIGNAGHDPEYFEGPMKESIVWLAMRFAEHSLARRFQVAVGRDRAEVDIGLGLNSTRHTRVTEDIKAMLDGIFDGDDDDSPEAAQSGPDPLDDYKP